MSQEKSENASEKKEIRPEKVEQPPEKVEQPPEKVEQPPEKVEQPPEKVEQPPEKNNTAPEEYAAMAASQQMYLEKWMDIALDTDRQLLTLSTAAIGLLATFVTSKGVSSISQLLLVMFAGLAFIAVIASILYIFRLNRDYIKTHMSGGNPEEGLMRFLDKGVRIAFFVGIACSVVYALSIAIDDLEKKAVVTQSKKGEKDESKSGEASSETSSGASRQREPSGGSSDRK